MLDSQCITLNFSLCLDNSFHLLSFPLQPEAPSPGNKLWFVLYCLGNVSITLLKHFSVVFSFSVYLSAIILLFFSISLPPRTILGNMPGTLSGFASPRRMTTLASLGEQTHADNHTGKLSEALLSKLTPEDYEENQGSVIVNNSMCPLTGT